MKRTSGSRNRQFGASLMELMVGITIGLLVVLAAIGSLVYTRVSSTTMVDATRLQQKADAAFRLINFQTLQAGAIELAATVDPATVNFSTAYTGFDPTVTLLPANVVSVNGTEGNGTTTQDVLRVSYQDNGAVRDCLGQATAALTANIRVDNVFTYVPTNGGGGNIICTGAASNVSQPILDGVEDFQVTYGVATAAGFRFFTANNITDWTNIQTVNICLQLRGDTQGNPQPGMAPIVGCVPPATIVNDGRLRRVFNRTFSLRNALL
jgi:type IV pilus assembly protein PilW